ncbi:MAG: response regulator [Bdellovibrionales bacterium]|nr:response regulator [Bdellovibrionales bacterium]
MFKTKLSSILLVEDNPSDIELTKRAFAKSNIFNPLDVVEDGEEALEYLYCQGRYANRDPNEMPALVLIDLKMPGIGGLEVIRQIRANPQTKRLLVVILTSSKEEQDVAMGYDLGVNSYIRKPVDFQKFAEVIKQMGMYWLVLNEPPAVE